MEENEFVAVLRQLDPEVSYSIQATTGGVVNVTVRATKSSHEALKGRFPGYQSLILKYATPYIAKIGKDAPFDQHRQIIEAQALSLFSTSSPMGLRELARKSQIDVPELLYHDPHKHILVIADLGSHPDLSEIFSSLGGYHPTLEPSKLGLDFFGTNELDATFSKYFQEMGHQIGSFFAHLHQPDVWKRIPDASAFDNPDSRRLMVEHVTKPAIESIQIFLGADREDDARFCATIMLQDTQRSLSDEEKSFTLGDCWTSAMLVSLPSDNRPPLVGVIDWEFAGLGRGPHGDMAQLLAHLEMLRISARQHSRFCAQLEALNVLIDSLTSFYSGRPRSRVMKDSMTAVKMRSALISCGTEMICCASWKKWVCANSNCRSKHDSSESLQECLLVREIVEEGISLIHLACEDTSAFCSDSNWLKIEEKSKSRWMEGKKWLLDLF